MHHCKRPCRKQPWASETHPLQEDVHSCPDAALRPCVWIFWRNTCPQIAAISEQSAPPQWTAMSDRPKLLPQLSVRLRSCILGSWRRLFLLAFHCDYKIVTAAGLRKIHLHFSPLKRDVPARTSAYHSALLPHDEECPCTSASHPICSIYNADWKLDNHRT